MNTVLLCAALLVILYAALSVNVSRVRIQGRGSSRATEAQLTQAVRAHGNAAEYIPLLVVLLLYLDSVSPSPFVTTMAVVAVLSRLLHAAAMLIAGNINQRHRLRFVGALGTYAALFGLGGALARHAL
jgi:uncharacterized protein